MLLLSLDGVRLLHCWEPSMVWKKSKYQKLLEEVTALKAVYLQKIKEVDDKILSMKYLLFDYTDRNLAREISTLSNDMLKMGATLDDKSDRIITTLNEDIECLTTELEKRLSLIKERTAKDNALVLDKADSLTMQLTDLIGQLRSIRGLSLSYGQNAVFMSVLPDDCSGGLGYIYPPFFAYGLEVQDLAISHLRTKFYLRSKRELNTRLKLCKVSGSMEKIPEFITKYKAT